MTNDHNTEEDETLALNLSDVLDSLRAVLRPESREANLDAMAAGILEKGPIPGDEPMAADFLGLN